MHCIQRFLHVFVCNFWFCSYFLLPCSCSREYPVGDYYVFDNGQNVLRDGDGAKLNEKKKKKMRFLVKHTPTLLLSRVEECRLSLKQTF